jgi:uncharacterized protein (DUF427 family)
VDGTVVAETNCSVVLYEATLPTRYYISKTDCNLELLVPSRTGSSCPYKGEANYYDIVIDGKEYKDYVWWYKYPSYESIQIAGRVCFYNEKVDIFLDGIQQQRPKSKFS